MNTLENTLYLIYDGDCILCRNSAQAIKIKQAIGNLEIINARETHPLVTEVMALGYNLNEGIIVKYQNQYYYGARAVNFLALVGSSSDTFNKLNSVLFKSKIISAFLYPIFKLVRNVLLYVRRIPPIIPAVTTPLIKMLYPENWSQLPSVLQQRYRNQPYSQDYLLMQGKMNIRVSKTFQFLSPLFRIAGALVPYPAENIPVTVELTSDKQTNQIVMHRTFFYENREPYHFYSTIIHIEDNLIIERMRFGFSSKLLYSYQDNTIKMNFGGYALQLGNFLIPIPLGFLIGKFDAVETTISDNEFDMRVTMTHFLFGKIFEYSGQFKIGK